MHNAADGYSVDCIAMDTRKIWKEGRQLLKTKRKEMLELGARASIAAEELAHRTTSDDWIIATGAHFEVQHGPYVLVVNYDSALDELPPRLELINVFEGTAKPVPAMLHVVPNGPLPELPE